MTEAVLVLNSGSSSIKFALYPAVRDVSRPLIKGKIAGIARAPRFSAFDGEGQALVRDGLEHIDASASHGELTLRMLDWLASHNADIEVVAAGHRVVHGGQMFTRPVLLSDDVMRQLEELVPLAPLHQPHNLSAIKALAKRSPELTQVACFDTSFHRTQPKLAQLFALPRALSDEGVIRYGFHGLSYDYISGVLGDHLGAKADGPIIVAHLGNGASLCALKERKSVGTSMGFTALDGLMMGRRCGRLDAGVVLHLMQNKGMSVEDVQRMLYRESGLLGVSGISNNMQVLQESEEPHARDAIELYCYRAASEMGSLLTALGGLDAIVFTAGIGENSGLIRQMICEHLAWMGLVLNAQDNTRNATRISEPASAIDVLVIPTNEELVIAKAVSAACARTASATS